MKNVIKIFRILNRNIKKLRRYDVSIDNITEEGLVSGWAIDRYNPSKKFEIEILVDGQLAGTARAEEYRPLLDKGEYDGHYGFTAQIDLDGVEIRKGAISLRDKLGRKNLKSNLAYIPKKKDLFNWMKKFRRKYIDSYSNSEDYWYEKLLEKEQYVELKGRLEEIYHKEGDISKELALILLALYLGEEEFVEALTLYEDVLSGSEDGKAELIILDYTSALMSYAPGEYRTPWEVRRLELIHIALSNDKIDSKKTLRYSIEKFDNLLAHMVMHGMLADKNKISLAWKLITGKENEGKTLKLYKDFLEAIEIILYATHRGDRSYLEKTEEILSLLYKDSFHSQLHRAIFYIVTEYINTLTTLGKIGSEESKNFLRIFSLLPKDLEQNWQMKIRKMEWFYYTGQKEAALEIFQWFIKNDIEYLDWRTSIFDVLLWHYYLSEGKKVDSRPLMDFLYRKEGEDRCTLTEHLIVLSDLQRWRESAGLGIVQRVVSRIVGSLPAEENSLKRELAFELIHRLMRGSDDLYVRYAGTLRDALEKKKLSAPQLSRAGLYIDQDLYTLSLLGEEVSQHFSPTELQPYEALLSRGVEEKYPEGNFQNEEWLIVPQKITQEVEEYFQGLAVRSSARILKVVVPEKDQVIVYTFGSNHKENTQGQRLQELSLPLEHSVRIWVLAGKHLPHHKSFVQSPQRPVSIYGSLSEDWSYVFPSDFLKDLLGTTDKKISTSMIETLYKKLEIRRKDLFDKEFEEMKAGILSFKNLEEELRERLVDFSCPLFEMDEPEKAIAYLKDLYNDPRVETPVSVNVGDTILMRIKQANSPCDDDALACFLVQRNEHLRLKGFFDYYRKLGVQRFYVIDNASDDEKTLSWLLDQEDVELYSTPQAYSQSLYGVRWAELLIKAKRLGKWNLVLDADELLMIDEDHYKDLPSLCRALDEEGYDALYTPFVDMYSKRAINATPYRPGVEILEECGYHDRHFYTTRTTFGGIVGQTPTYQGGIRSRTFGLDKVVLNKLPLFKFTPRLRLREGLHWIDHAKPKMGEGVLLHFKYLETFHQYVEREIDRGQHWNGASEYKKYHNLLMENPEFSLYNPILSTRYKDVKSFFRMLSKPFGDTGDQ